MDDLFADAAERPGAACRPRCPIACGPTSLDGFVGQAHVVGPGTPLRRAIEEDRVSSTILYGPPGTGKTTLARIVASATGAAFEELSAVNAGKADVHGGDRARPRPPGRSTAGARSSSSTRSTASTRRSRTRSCRWSSPAS